MGSDEKLVLREVPTVVIVQKVLSTIDKTHQQTSPPWQQHGFLGQVVDLALYETDVLGSKPPPGGLSTLLPCLSIHATHKPTLNLCTPFVRMEWGLLVSPYKIGTRFSLRHRTLCQGRWARSTIAQMPSIYLTRHMSEQPSLRRL